jgi:ABC-type spermidine/putrescine transport system permease subunit I
MPEQAREPQEKQMATIQEAVPLGPVAPPAQPVPTGRGRRTLKAYAALSPFLVLYGALIVIPTLGMLVKSVSKNDSAALEILNPSLLVHTSFTLVNYQALFTEGDNINTIITTVVISLIAVGVTVVVGTPIAYQLAMDRTKLTGAASWVLSLPIYMPTVVIAYALVLLFGPNGILNSAATAVHLPIVDISFTTTAVVLGTVYVLVPLYVRMLRAAFAQVPEELMQASMSLGANEFRTLLKVMLPVVRPTMIAAVILDFAFAVGMVEIALIVGGGTLNVPYLPVNILQRSTTFAPDLPLTAAMATVLVVIALAGQLLAGRFNKKATSNAAR